MSSKYEKLIEHIKDPNVHIIYTEFKSDVGKQILETFIQMHCTNKTKSARKIVKHN